MSTIHPITIITHPRYLDHDTGGGDHPESPHRLKTIFSALGTSILADHISFINPQEADRSILCSFHEENYLFRFEEAALSGRTHIDHPDNQISFDSYEIALLAAGAGITAIDLLEKSGELCFCCVRPPGHHAERAMALGFCFFNNAVIAAHYWQQIYHRRRIAIIDWDAHHGNGIQAAFEDDPNVFYISIHEHPTFSFPGSGYSDEVGVGAGKGSILNIPLPPGAGDETAIKALREKISPALDTFQPDAIIVCAGFDGHRLDDMSGLGYSTDLYGQLGAIMAEYGNTYCRGKLLTILEGGYHLQSLGESVTIYLHALAKNSS